MNRTQKNIKKYEGMLPGLKEKVAAAAMLFAMTAAMLVTSTFAWLTLSYNPQVQDVHTAVASNGNLEIALASGDIDNAIKPEESTVQDGSLETVSRNLTWGNLINLNDTHYGLSHIVMRPAILNDSNLIERPLYGPVYDSDGRVKDLDTNFGYSSWESIGDSGRFTSTKNLGVRAITSMKYGESGAAVTMNLKLLELESANARLRTNYESMANNDVYMEALASMMVGYMIENRFKQTGAGDYLADAPLNETDLRQFGKMYETLIGLFEDQADVYAALLNLQAEIKGDESLKITADEILALEYGSDKAYNKLLAMGYETYASSVKTVGIIKDMDNFLKDYNTLKGDLVRINDLLENHVKGSINWIDCPTVEGGTKRIIDSIIDNLTNVNDCTITGGDLNNTKVSAIGGTAALGLASSCGKDNPAQTKITNGILLNFDNRCGGRIKNPETKPLKLVVEPKGLGALMGTQTIYSHVSTTATDNYFENERAYLANMIKGEYAEPDLIAKDSYGFAVDFWVRTNAASSYLTLEGNVLTETEDIDVKGKDSDGNEVQLYTMTVELESSETGSGQGGGILDSLNTVSFDVYPSAFDEQDNPTEWRFADSHQVVTAESLGLAEGAEIPEPRKKVTQVENIIGFEGENRVWNGDEHSLLSVSSTTQGSGSCYTFYAETPADQQRSLNLLKSMKVAFVSGDGELLTIANMDTERYYASAGKVTVPLVLDTTKSQAITVLDGETKYAITSLEQNVPKRITAIVYLDGANLTNEDVLAAADIQGQMNIQFGSSAALVPLDNETLYNSEFYAEVTEITETEFEYADNADMTTTVKVKVTGTQPSEMKAYFIRRINATQGTPEAEPFVLTDADGDGIWEGSYTFKNPGEYILRSVWVDGTERDLRIPEGEDYKKVTVKGFTIQKVQYLMDKFVMTDADSYSGEVNLEFATNEQAKMPKTVVGKFMRTDGAEVNVNFAYNSTENKWQGTANFAYSGEYTMQYVLLDGLYEELPSSMQTTVDLTLGMRVNVETTSPKEYISENPDDSYVLKMRVEIFDNNNDIVENIGNAILHYKATGMEPIIAELKYNSGAHYYEGELSAGSGVWSFDKVEIQIGDSYNSLRKVNADAPVFRIVPPTPPSFVDNQAVLSQYLTTKSGGNGKFSVTLADTAGTAVVYAKVIKGEDTVIYVPSTSVSEAVGGHTYTFDINESGLWKVESVAVFGMFDENQVQHAVPNEVNDQTYSSGIVFDSSNSAFAEKEIAVLFENDITVSYGYNDDLVESNTIVLGKDKDGTLTRTFMQATNLPEEAIKVIITDKENLISRGYFNVKNVTLGYKYGSLTDSSGKSYGGYVSSDYDNGIKGTDVGALNFTAKNNTLFALTNANGVVNFDHSAQYTADKLSYTITSDFDAEMSQTSEVANAGAHPIVLYSKAPLVTVSAVTPTGNYSKDTNTSGSISDSKTTTSRQETGKDSCGKETTTTYYTHKWTTNSKHQAASSGSFISDDKLSATVYYKCLHSDETTYGGNEETTEATATNQRYHSFSDGNANVPGTPTVTLNLSGISGFTNATLNFSNNTHLYTKVTTTDKVGEGSGEGIWDNITGLFSPNKEMETTDAANYSWTSEGDCMRYVGYSWSKDHGSNKAPMSASKKTPAGTITATQLDVVYGGKTYNFTIDKVTINNPY